MEMEILKTRNFPAEAMDGDGMWEEKARQTREEGERRKIGRWWVDGEGDQMMDDKAGNADTVTCQNLAVRMTQMKSRLRKYSILFIHGIVRAS